MKETDITVSICCITYNHEKFIKQAIDSFLMQKTKFKYEIVVHDDASTDNTPNILKEYKEKYPDKFKLILQTKNQFSQGKKATKIVMEAAQGKYIALCEGDDYWIDENKLQMQVDYMEKNSNCTLCFHNAYKYSEKYKTQKIWLTNKTKFLKKDNIYNVGELDILDFIPTASYMFRTENVKNIPDWFEKCKVGDRPLKLIMTSFGYAYYIDKVMSVYRIDVTTSAMGKIYKELQEREKAIKHYNDIEWIIDKVNEFTNYEYDSEFIYEKQLINKNRMLVNRKYKRIIYIKDKYEWLKRKEHSRIFMQAYFGKIYNILKKIKGVLRGKK